MAPPIGPPIGVITPVVMNKSAQHLAPNKKMQKLLARYFAVVTCCENNTSKISSCCHNTTQRTTAHPNQNPNRRPRADVLVCDTCSCLLSRDRMARRFAPRGTLSARRHYVRAKLAFAPVWIFIRYSSFLREAPGLNTVQMRSQSGAKHYFKDNRLDLPSGACTLRGFIQIIILGM